LECPYVYIASNAEEVLHVRLALIILVAEATFCCWVLEQPSGSADTLPYHHRLDWLFNQVIYVSYLHWTCTTWETTDNFWGTSVLGCHAYDVHKAIPKVFRQDFWMMHWGAQCPKRTSIWSSDADIIMKLVMGLSIECMLNHNYWAGVCWSVQDRGTLTKDEKEKKRTLATTSAFLSVKPDQMQIIPKKYVISPNPNSCQLYLPHASLKHSISYFWWMATPYV